MPRRHRDDPFADGAVRDLLGLVRAIYAMVRHDNPNARERLARIGVVGRRLTETLDAASKAAPGSASYEAALQRADTVAHDAIALVDFFASGEELVTAARARVVPTTHWPLPRRKPAER